MRATRTLLTIALSAALCSSAGITAVCAEDAEQVLDKGAGSETQREYTEEEKVQLELMRKVFEGVGEDCRAELQQLYQQEEPSDEKLSESCKKEIEVAAKKTREGMTAEMNKGSKSSKGSRGRSGSARAKSRPQPKPKVNLDHLWDPTPVIVGFVVTCLAGVVGYVVWVQSQIGDLAPAKTKKNKKKKGTMR